MFKLLLFEVVVLLLGVGIWLGAPFIGITSVWLRVLIILALVLPPIIYFVVKAILSRKASQGLEDGLKQQAADGQASARPGANSEEIALLTEGFEEAMGRLRNSRLDGAKGTALYALPWYMIVGPPAAGKSTALLRSGLNLPPQAGGKRSVKGVGGTRNCDWWFFEDAILLDTAGRYTSEDEDYEEWVEFLRLLKRYRRKRPLNGLIVCISISDMITASPDQVEEIANKVRSRLDQIITELEMIVPVYVLFSKADLLGGFVEFFGDLERSKRDQVFGFTVPLATPGADLDNLFNEEFDILLGTLRRRMLHRLPAAQHLERAAVYRFPMQLADAREPLRVFITKLFAKSRYQEAPRLRGVYWCSGTQEGKPLDQVMNKMEQALGLDGISGAAQGEQATNKKSYFLHHLFTRVLIPDRNLAGKTASNRTRRWRLSLAAMVLGLTVSLVGVSLATLSFSKNRSLVNNTTELAESTRLKTVRDPDQVMKNLRALEEMGKHIELLSSYREEGPPWTHGFGYYSGDELEEPTEAVFAKRMFRIFADLAGMELEASLADINQDTWQGSGDDAARGYDLLKTYLMVTEPERMEVEFALKVLLGEWTKRLPPQVTAQEELLKTLAQRFLKLRKRGLVQAKWLERDKALVVKVRKRLLEADVLYKRSIERLESQLAPYTLKDALQGRVETRMESKNSVPGVFTRDGYNKVKSLVKKAEGESWVLWKDETVKTSDKLMDRYFDKYSEAWLRFLMGLNLTTPRDKAEALTLLDKLTGSPPLYELLLKSVAFQTDFSPSLSSDTLGTAIDRRGGKLRKLKKNAEALGLDKKARDAASGARTLTKVEKYFVSFHAMVSPPPAADGSAQVSGLKQYQEKLTKVANALSPLIRQETGDTSEYDQAVEEADRFTERLMQGFSPAPLGAAVKRLLIAPLRQGRQAVITGVSEATGESFSENVCTAFAKVAGKYPFGRGTEEALFMDVAELFAPTTGKVWAFFDQTLKDQVELKGTRYQVKEGKRVSASILAFYNKARAVTEAFFPAGSTAPAFTFTVQPAPAIVAEGSPYLVSEIKLSVDGMAQTYRNGPRDWWMFKWPGETLREARLSVRGDAGLSEQIVRQGDWALLRLIDDARVVRRGNLFQLEWNLKEGNIRVQMVFKPQRSENPLALQRLLRGGMRCP